MMVDRVEPTSLISSKKATKARAVHTSPSRRIEATTVPGGKRSGRCQPATGAYTTATATSDTVASPRLGR